MGINQSHVLGEQQRFYCAIEATKGTYQPPLATDACKVMSTTIDVDLPQEQRDDANEGLDDYELTPGKLTVGYTIEKRIAPSGTAGTIANDAPLLQALFGVQTINSGTSVVYSLSNTQLMPSLSLTRLFNAVDPISMEAVFGFLMDEGTLSVPGGEKPKWTFKGEAMGHIATGNTTASGAAGPGTTVATAATQGFGFEVGSRVQVGANTGPGAAGNVISAVASALLTAAGSSITYLNGDRIQPFAPTPTTIGQVLGHTLGSLTMDAVAFPITAFEMTIKRNMDFVKDEFGAAAMTDGIVGRRTIMGKVTVRGRADMVRELAYRKQRTNRAIVMTMGNVAGRIDTVSLPQVRLDIKGQTVGSDKVGTIDLTFRALASAEGALNAVTYTRT